MRLRPSTTAIRWTVGIVLAVVVLAWFTSPNPASQDDDGDPFTGRWLINGEDPFGTEYSGSLSIVAEDSGYRLDWIITGAVLQGTGVPSGDERRATWTGTIAGDDNVIRLWDPETGDQRGVFTGHTAAVCYLQFSDDEKLLASAGYDFTVRIWRASVNKQDL